MFNIRPPPTHLKIVRLWNNVEKYGRAGEAVLCKEDAISLQGN